MYKYGIISTASITKRFITGLRQAGDEVVCIGSRDINKAKQFAEDNNINKYFGSYEEVYDDPNVDVVYIPVINCLHYECAKQALLHKKNVVLEKPFTTSLNDARELFELANNNKCFLFEGVKNLFVSSTEFVKSNLSTIGTITNIKTLQGTKNPFPSDHWMYDISKGGGAYFGSAAYVFHYLRYLCNDNISSLDGNYIPSSNSDLICDFKFNIGEIKVESTIDLSKDLDNTCTIYGTKGSIIIYDFWRSHHVVVNISNENTKEFTDDGNEFVYEIKHIQNCLENKLIESPIIKGVDSINEVENIEYLYKKWKLI